MAAGAGRHLPPFLICETAYPKTASGVKLHLAYGIVLSANPSKRTVEPQLADIGERRGISKPPGAVERVNAVRRGGSPDTAAPRPDPRSSRRTEEERRLEVELASVPLGDSPRRLRGRDPVERICLASPEPRDADTHRRAEGDSTDGSSFRQGRGRSSTADPGTLPGRDGSGARSDPRSCPNSHPGHPAPGRNGAGTSRADAASRPNLAS